MASHGPIADGGRFARLVPHLFYLFLTSPVLSPEVSNTSVYLFLFVPLIDPNFLVYLSRAKFDRRYVVASLLLLGLSIPYGSILFVFKIASILLTVSYLFYTRRIHAFYLYPYCSLNVLVASIQFAGTVFLGVDLLFPSAVGEFLYGPYALATGGTGVEGYILESRFSGLSREPGFFSSLLIASFLLLMDDRTVRHKGFYMVVHLLGILVSFSKISLVFFLVFIPVWAMRRWIERVPKWVIVGGTLAIMIMATRYLHGEFGGGPIPETLSHRTIGYGILERLSPGDLLFGVGYRNIASRAHEIPLIYQSIWYEKMPSAITSGSGLSSIIIDTGLVYFLALLLILYYLEVRSWELLLFLAFTINENPLTTSSFVLLGIYYLLASRYKGHPANLGLQGA